MTNELGPVTDTELLKFLSDLNGNLRTCWIDSAKGTPSEFTAGDHFDKFETIGAQIGPKYIRIVKHRAANPGETFPTSEVTTAAGVARRVVASAFCFIDRATGNILKPAGFKTPAKGIRGNIRGGWWRTAVGPYGAISFRG